MMKIYLAVAFCALTLLACNPGEKQTDNSDHFLKEHKSALDKAKAVDRLAEEAAERQRKALEENR